MGASQPKETRAYHSISSYVRLMETGRSLLSTPTPPPRNHLKNQIPISVGNFPRSLITQESCETYKGYYLSKEETFKLATAAKLHLEDVESSLYWLQPREFTLTARTTAENVEKGQRTPSLASNLSESGAGLKHKSAALSGDKRNIESCKETISTEVTVVRSNRLMERRLKKRKVTKIPKYDKISSSSIARWKLSKKNEKSMDSSDPLRFFTWGFEYRKFLTREEEKEVITNIQNLIRLEEAKERFKSQFNREPIPIELARTVGMSARDIDSCVVVGKCSLEKIVHTNFRLVLHIAKQHLGNGIGIEDLVQEGYKGLMRGLRKFKTSKGCRFKTYATFWIKCSIRKAIQETSRTIRLPVRWFELLRKIKKEKKLCIQEGCAPEEEEIARRVGITTQKLRKVLWYGREPVSLHDRIIWHGQVVTYQEITADPTIEQPDIALYKLLMRQHVPECLNILKPRERIVILHRFGIFGRGRKSLSEIGNMFGLTKERIRQIECCAMQKLREIALREDLSAYTMFLT